MDEPSAQPSIRTRRIGLTRFIVPHASFGWYVRGTAISALACGALFGAWSWLFHRRIFVNLGIAERPDYAELASAYQMMTLSLAGLMAITAALFMAIASMFLFHRVAGPVYRLKMHMLDVIEGRKVGELSLRDTDQLTDLCEIYNQLLSNLDLLEPKPLEQAEDPSAPTPD